MATHPAGRGRPALFSPFSRAPVTRALAILLSGTALIHTGAALAQEAQETRAQETPETPQLLGTLVLHGASVMDEDSSIVAGYTATGSKTVNEVIDVPAQVSVVTARELETRAPETLTSALAYTASVSVDEYGSDNRYDFFRIRGFLQNGTGTYRDGLPLRTFNFTGGRIEPYSVQRIEVLKGSTSTLFGLNAPGGLVNVITKRPQNDPFGEVYSTVGDSHAELGFDMGAPLDENGEWTYRITGKWQDGQNQGDYLNDDRRYGAVALTWKPGDRTSLTLLGNIYRIEGNAGNSTPIGSRASRETYFGEPSFNRLDRDERSIGYEFSHDFGQGLSFRQNLRWSEFDFGLEQVYISDVVGSEAQRAAYSIDGNVRRFAVDNQLQFDTSFGDIDSRSLLGVEYVSDDLYEVQGAYTVGSVDIDRPVYCAPACLVHTGDTITDMTQETLGLYAQEELTFRDQWILTLGLRHDRVETDTAAGVSDRQTATTGRIGLTYKATPDLAFYANYSESFDPVSVGYTGLTGESLRPTEGTQYEIGVKYRPEGSDALISAAIFDLSQTNVPRYDVVGGVPAFWQIGQIDVQGLEIEGRMAMNDRLNLNFAYAYWDAKIVGGDNDGRRPILTPEHTASVWADYTLEGGAFDGIRLGGGARLLGSRYSDDTNAVRIGSAVVFDAMTSVPLGENTELAVNVSNLFDREYVASYNFTNSAAFYGDGRIVKATLRHRW
ncbi:TonB-dependent siderophore receptor [Halodurantibacterium flavum]|uniref:TonB-dependent siderophore receptor n=1 Tax=Halodurantibacterium flavum TaxID=1382802 RepID=A0ABW4S389_9RHOB